MVQLQLGPEQIRSYRRLAYTPWHALAEFVDNSTQSYFDHKEELDRVFRERGEALEVSIVVSRDDGLIRVSDNAMGMSLDELQRGLRVGVPPENTSGRSRYGMGMKTAACWFGEEWSVRTKRLGDDTEHEVTVDVELVARGELELPYRSRGGRDPNEHYTILEIRRLNRTPVGRTLGKIKDYLRSMYRVDIRSETLLLVWQGERLHWEPDEAFVRAADGTYYRRDFSFDVDGKSVRGWVGVLERGSRAKAGFSILHSNRVVRGWPDSWRPTSIFGQEQGTNDLVNQRLTGEVHLDDFDVSHTKDDILWLGEEEERVERKLKDECAEYREFATRRRKGDRTSPPLGDLEVEIAVRELESELTSSEMVDAIAVEVIPPPDVVASAFAAVKEAVDTSDPTFRASIATQAGPLEILGFLSHEPSPNDPYVVSESTTPERVLVIINMQHPHIKEITGGSESLLVYLRHCVYDAIAEWQARNRASTIDPDTIKILKDKLLRLQMEIQMHNPALGEPEVELVAEELPAE